MAKKPGVHVEIEGLDKAIDYLERIEHAANAVERAKVGVGVSGRARLYSYGIEFGHKRSGQLARAAGGVFFMTGAVGVISPRLDDQLAKALEKGPAESTRTMNEATQNLEAEAQRRETAVVSGNLRRSIHAFGEAGSGLGRS